MQPLTPDELRLLNMCHGPLIRMLEGREERIIQRMCGALRNGTTDHLSNVAELACVRDQINEINTALQQFNKGAVP